MLSSPITCKSFQLIARRRTKIGQHNGSIHHLELAASDPQDSRRKTLGAFAGKHHAGPLVGEISYHGL